MKNRIDDIEILRGISVLVILVHHARGNLLTWNTPWLERFYSYISGTGSVDLFFCISGFVITRNIAPRLAQCADMRQFLVTAIDFWIRRIWRLLPSAWLCLGVILLLAAAFNRSGVFGAFAHNFAGVIAAMLQVANLHFAYAFENKFGMGATFHFWTLSLEEQFYMTLPFLVFFSRRALPWIVGIALVAQILLHRSPVPLIYWMLRTEAMLFGVLLALWAQKPTWQLFTPAFLGRSALVRGLVLPGVVLAIAFVGSDLNIVQHQIGVMATLAAVLVWIASYDRNFLMAPGPLKTLLIWTGTRSYALYLWHIPVFFMTREIWFRASAEGTQFDTTWTATYIGTAAVLLVVIAELNYRLIEMPLRKRGAAAASGWYQRHAPQAPVTPAVAGTI